jgi:DnaK suppressor protein
MVATTDEELETLAARESREIAEDAATGTVGELLSRLQGLERDELDEIDAAQARLESGVFGECEDCRNTIPLKRLRALPTARRCALCQDQLETQR